MERTPAQKLDVRTRYLFVDTSNVADILDTLGYTNQALTPTFQSFPVTAGKLAGWAYTIRGQKASYPIAGGDPDKMSACQGLSAGEISVWSGDGEGICYFGELIAIGMKERGSTGAIVDGGIRDVRWIGEQDFPVYARYRTPVQSIGRWKVNAWQIPVRIRGATSEFVTVNPGDFILADEDGIVVVPDGVVESVLEQAEKLTETERLVRKELKAGLPLSAALTKYGHI
jgi:4-hydroxy-4-methyl-2-oxoglutarate aldolase